MSDTSREDFRGRFDSDRFFAKSDEEIDREAELEYARLGIDASTLRFRVVTRPIVSDLEPGRSQETTRGTLPLFFERGMMSTLRVRLDRNADRKFVKPV